MSHKDVYLLFTSISDNIVLFIELVLKSWTQLQQKLTTVKEPPVIRVFCAFEKKPDLDC